MPRYKLRTLLILLAVGPPMLAVILPPLVQWLKREPVQVAPPITNRYPYLAVYPIGTAEPATTLNVVATLLKGTPNTGISLDGKSGTLVVLAPASVQNTVKAIVSDMQRGVSQEDETRPAPREE